MKQATRLEDLLDGRSKEESRIILKRFYDEEYRNGKYRPPNGKKIWERLLAYIPKFSRGLDIGCGMGEGLSIARKYGYNVWGIDLANASDWWKKNGIHNRCCVASAIHLPFWDNAFDFVISSDVLEHIPEWDISLVLNEMHRVGSRIILVIIALEYDRERGEENIYRHITVKPSAWWMQKFKESGFQIRGPVFEINKHHLIAGLRK